MFKLKSSNIQIIICNSCGKEIKIENGVSGEDYISINKNWGYFSEKDGYTMKMDICENCIDHIISNFKVPAKIEAYNEYL